MILTHHGGIQVLKTLLSALPQPDAQSLKECGASWEN